MSTIMTTTRRRATAIAFALVLGFTQIIGLSGAQAVEGGQQSPINFSPSHTSGTPTSIQFMEFHQRIRYVMSQSDHHGEAGPRETTVQLKQSTHGSQTDLSIKFGGKSYKLQNIHWHIGSEHSIGGRHADMEQHMVFSDDQGKIVVVGAFMNRSEKVNLVYENLFQNLSKISHPLSSDGITSIFGLVPTGKRFEYTGSLTTSPYSPDVTMVIFEEPLSIGEKEYNAWKNKFPEGNNRETQPLLPGTQVKYGG